MISWRSAPVVGVVCVLKTGGDVMSDDPIAVKRAKEWAKVWAKAAEEEAWEAWVKAKKQAESNDGGQTDADLRAKAAAWVKAKATAKAAEESSNGDPTDAASRRKAV